MALAVATHTFNFDSDGTASYTHDFGKLVRSAGAALQGFDIKYNDNVDHHVQAIDITIKNVKIVETTKVKIDVDFLLRDEGSHRGKGALSATILADIDPA